MGVVDTKVELESLYRGISYMVYIRHAMELRMSVLAVKTLSFKVKR